MSLPTKAQVEAWRAFESYKSGIEIQTAHFTEPFFPGPPIEPRQYVKVPVLVDQFLGQQPEHLGSRYYLIEFYGGQDRPFIVKPSVAAD